MDWYLKALLQDRRFRIAALTAGGVTVLTLVSFLIGRTWAIRMAQFGFLPILILSILAIFGILGLVIRKDYKDRGEYLKKRRA